MSFEIMPCNKTKLLYHVGTMDITKKRKSSFEGDGLSVSPCPEAWKKITEGNTYGITYALIKEDAKYLDYYALTTKEKEVVIKWGKKQDLCEEKTLYKAIFYDEDGEEWFSLFSSFEEALEETDDEDLVKEIKGIIPTKKFIEETYIDIDLISVFDFVLEKYAEEVLDYDGIYWNEILDIPSLSAPRGVIFNNKLSTFTISTDLNFCENVSYDDEMMEL